MRMVVIFKKDLLSMRIPVGKDKFSIISNRSFNPGQYFLLYVPS